MVCAKRMARVGRQHARAELLVVHKAYRRVLGYEFLVKEGA